MNHYDAMRLFVQAAETASFTQAADILGVPKASVSNAVKQMEARLGARLFTRTTRRVALTQEGRMCLDRCKDILADIGELDSLFSTDKTVSGRLRVDMPHSLACALVIPHLPFFFEQHPGLELDLSTTDRSVDLLREGFDCVLRVGAVRESTLIARPLGALPQVNCASARYLEKFGEPRTLDDLRQHRLVMYAAAPSARDPGWQYFDGERYAHVPMGGVLTVNGVDAYQAACLAGLGMIQAPAYGLRDHLASRALREVMPHWRAAPLPVTLLYADRRHAPLRLRVFMQWLSQLIGQAYPPAARGARQL
ncbi:LysR family transcriptional regulator [Bordetella sp. FB-8]|uniref:LysR family transcriptional regulator n=1 Tax=Bordetella sp. FB-8 TaxID=1159870 RepID=UPI00035EAD98|nr:LysR family transcriptional regulator [Bordetella sp. FB-8]